MTAVKGSLLVTAEGMELAHVADVSRDQAVGDFHRMKTEAERQHDRFYALIDLFSHQFSYGDFYTGLLFRPWSDFHADHILSSISQKTYQLLQSFSQCIMLHSIDNEAVFMQKEKPHAHTGYCNPNNYEDYVGCESEWEEWHRKWYTAHPEDIDWSIASSDWLPRQDLILEILKRELQAKFVEDGLTPEAAEQKVAFIADKKIVHEFHDKVMGHKGDALEGYASQIGGEICRCNYYTYEAELSDLERKYAKSLREIYSIVNKDGKMQFISIDFSHGMFEFHDENGMHQGEFRFDSSPNSGIETDHSLKCMDLWHKQIGR
jgi:hypothetical protein